MRSGTRSVDDVRAGVVGRLRGRRGELIEAIFARVVGDAFEHVGDDDAEYVAGLRAAVAAAVEYGLQGIERDPEGAGPVPAVAVEQARRAARAGVSLDTVLRRYVLGHTLLWDFVMEEADRLGEDRALREMSRLQASVLDRLVMAVTREHAAESERAGRSREQRLSERVRSLLDGERLAGVGCAMAPGFDPELDYDLDVEHVAVIVRGAGAGEAAQVLRALAEGLDRRLLCVERAEGTVWAWLGARRPIEMAALQREIAEHAQACPAGVSFAVGEPARGLAGWRLTHRQAQAALMVALRRPRAFTRYADVALLASALKDEALARALVEIYLSPLEDARGSGPVLRKTLRAYLVAECNASSARVGLGVSRTTVINRLRTIEARLGRRLHPCPAELEVALELDELASLQKPEISIIGEVVS